MVAWSCLVEVDAAQAVQRRTRSDEFKLDEISLNNDIEKRRFTNREVDELDTSVCVSPVEPKEFLDGPTLLVAQASFYNGAIRARLVLAPATPLNPLERPSLKSWLIPVYQDSMWSDSVHSAMKENCQLSTAGGTRKCVSGSPRPHADHSHHYPTRNPLNYHPHAAPLPLPLSRLPCVPFPRPSSHTLTCLHPFVPIYATHPPLLRTLVVLFSSSSSFPSSLDFFLYLILTFHHFFLLFYRIIFPYSFFPHSVLYSFVLPVTIPGPFFFSPYPLLSPPSKTSFLSNSYIS